jgi:hypothetical protein
VFGSVMRSLLDEYDRCRYRQENLDSINYFKKNIPQQQHNNTIVVFISFERARAQLYNIHNTNSTVLLSSLVEINQANQQQHHFSKSTKQNEFSFYNSFSILFDSIDKLSNLWVSVSRLLDYNN